MKLPFILALLLLMACGCAWRKQDISTRDERLLRSALGHTRIAAQPPITITSQFAGVCPYCGEINLSMSCVTSGGSSFHPLVATLTNDEGSGTIQSWTISFRCRNCLMPFSDHRDQFVPSTRTVRLPIFGQ